MPKLIRRLFLAKRNLTVLCSVWLFVAGCAGLGGGNHTTPPPSLSIVTSSIPAGVADTPYVATISASGGTAPYSWSLTSGTLPSGLSLNSATGTISGTPSVAASSVALVFMVTDSSNPAVTKSANFALTIAPATLSISTTSLPNGQVGTAYSVTLGVSGGVAPYTWSLTSGTLPAGLSLNVSTGAITGTPSAVVTTAALTFQALDSSNPALTKTVNLTLTIVGPSLTITTSSLPNGQVGAVYNTTLGVTGGVAPYTWTLTSGTLPAGLALNGSSGAITGTPTAAVTNAALTFLATDSSTPALTKSGSFTLTIAPPALAISTSSLPTGQVGTTYNATLAATGGTTPYSWTLTSGTLPSGLTLNASSGAITGTPTVSVTASALTFKVTDSSNPALTKTASLTLTISPAALAISTSSLPNGQVGAAYNATLAATGGVTPYTWSLTSGTLPNGLTLGASGAITGTPTAAAPSVALTFQVKDSSAAPQTKTVNLTITVTVPSSFTVSISPKRAGLTITQTLLVTATTNDPQGVTWSATGASCTGNACGSFSPGTSLSGAAIIFTAAPAAGVYSITATSVSDITASASVTIGVTDLAGVFTWHDDLNRDGSNAQEYALSPALVATATFGKLFACSIDAAAYAQPLWAANLNFGGANHNALFVATQHDTIYAFDADNSPCQTLASRSLLGANETWLSNTDVGTGDITPDIGIVGTPVIDPSTNTIYVVSKSKSTSGANYFQRLHALNLADLSEKANSPVQIATGGQGSFALIQNQRAGLVLSGSSVYVTWASHGDNGAYHGFIYQYDKTALTLTATFNDTPTGTLGGIWMAGAAPAVDSSGNLYFITGNGTFNAANSNYGDSFLRLTGSLAVSDYFTPSDQANDEAGDADFGSGGAAILVNSGALTHLAVGGGKDQTLYVLNRDNMGHLGDSNSAQHFTAGGSIFSTAAFWQNTLYISPAGAHLQAYPLTNNPAPFGALSSQSSNSYGWPGSTPSISSQGASNGIVWTIENAAPAVLHAFDATNLATELWNSSKLSGDAAGTYVKFTVPTVANGKVYVGNSSQVTVYGLKAN